MANLSKIVQCASNDAYNGIAEKDENALYLTPDGGVTTYAYNGAIEKDAMNVYSVDSSLVDSNAQVGDLLVTSNGLFKITDISEMGTDKFYSVETVVSYGGGTIYFTIPGAASRRDLYLGYGYIVPQITNATYKLHFIRGEGMESTDVTLTLSVGVETSLGPYDDCYLYKPSVGTDCYYLFPKSGGSFIADKTTSNWIDGAYLEIIPN